MGYKHYNLQLTLRVATLLIIAIGVGVFLAKQHYFLLGITVLALIIAIYRLFYFLNKTHQQINFFVKAIKNDDTTLRFPDNTGSAIINEVHQSLNELNKLLQEVKLKVRIKEQYFSEILQNISTGVIVFSGKYITDVNKSAMDLLGVFPLKHISQIGRADADFAEQIDQMKGNEQQVLTYNKKNDKIQINTTCTEINIGDNAVKLITLQDIRSELERKEVDAWIKLIRVLSHEIMNALTPITSISQSLKDIWEQQNKPAAEQLQFNVDKTTKGLGVIAEMSEGLVRFVQSYRILSKPPQPLLSKITAHNFFDRLNILTSPFREDFSGTIQFTYPQEDFNLLIDEHLMVQVVTNLIKNAVEVFETDSSSNQIVIDIEKHKKNILLRVTDNGSGIPPEIQEQIFVPFFTTKQNGSGIGLSYSKQIIRAHGGTLNCKSQAGETVFTITIPMIN